MTKAKINVLIRKAKIAISEAEMAGLRGAEMIAVKRRLIELKAAYKVAA